MGTFQRFQDEGYKNWIKTSLGLAYLKTRLESFLENETEAYHQDIQKTINWDGQECQQKCTLKDSAPKLRKVPPPVCEMCAPWRDEIWRNHKGGQIYWNNFSPYLWPKNKWEVAKVYMPRGNSKHNSADTFDISAFLNLMTNCLHFKQFVQNTLLTQVTNVRNQVMHSANFEVKAEQLKQHLDQIRVLGKALEKHAPEFQILDKKIDQLQNLDFTVIMSAMETEQGVQTDSEDRGKTFLSMELDIMKEKMECLAQEYEGDRENMLKPEELQCVRQFLEENNDLKESLVPQWERLKEVQEQHGQQIDSLTGRVDELERKSHTPGVADSEWDTDIMMYKNHLFEYARKHGCSEPVFTQIPESTGFRSQVSIKNQTFTGMRVHRAKRQADQEVAKIALEQLAKETASEQVDEDTSVSQAHKSESVSAAGSTFFGSVTVGLDVTVFSDEGGGGTMEGAESAYRKLMSAFGLELSGSGSYKDAVVQYCLRRDIPAPEEIDKSDCFTLRLKGPITFYDSEGSSKKKQAQQQAAKAALQGLSGVLGKKEVLNENYVGGLKELLEARKQEGFKYSATQRPVSSGEREGGLGNQESQSQGAERQRERESGQAATERSTEETIKALGRKRSVDDMPGSDGRIEDAVDLCRISESPTVQPSQSLKSQVPLLQPHATETQTAIASSEEISVSEVGGRFWGCVKVTIKMELEPAEALCQEGAVQAAYSSLSHALCLGPTTCAGGERDLVLGFFALSECNPPVEKVETTADGKHRCTLTIDGELTFYSPEGSSRKQQAEQLAAKEALRHLVGLLEGKDSNLDGERNYKGILQELLAKQGSKSIKPKYTVTEKETVTAPVQVPDGSFVIGPGQQSGVPLVIPPVTMDTAFDDSAPPPAKKIAKPQADGPMEEIRQFLLLVSVKPGTVVCESVNLEEKWECRVSVSLECFTFQDPRLFTSKKEASDNAYLTLGCAGQICQPDETKVKGKVNQYFSQHSFPLPKDVYEQPEPLKFCCSLTNITCVFTYTGTDSSEASARQAAFQTALSCISPLMGLPLVQPRAEEAEQRLKTLLETAGVKTTDPGLTSALYRSSAMLTFTGYCMETEGEGSKKETRHKLSQRLLGLLQGPDTAPTSKDQSMRSALQEWFAKKHLENPVFEDTDGQFGTRITFSAPLCLYSDWQDSHKKAGGKLVEELKRRFLCLPV